MIVCKNQSHGIIKTKHKVSLHPISHIRDHLFKTLAFCGWIVVKTADGGG